MIITTDGIIIRLSVENISQQGRITQGVKIMRLGDKDRIASVAKAASREDEEN
jgi:DNA gyrase subunit A